MALKEWKKGDFINHFINKFTKETIAIIYDYPGYENTWLVAISDKYDDVIKEKSFKSKSQALKFAKSYMRKY